MEKLSETIKKLLELMGLNDFEINFNEPSKRFSITIDDHLIAQDLPKFLEDFEYLVNLISQKELQQFLKDDRLPKNLEKRLAKKLEKQKLFHQVNR